MGMSEEGQLIENLCITKSSPAMGAGEKSKLRGGFRVMMGGRL
jgi:hypothetical protein